MRMWNVNPELMCRQHLLGEHLEMHMFLGNIKKGIDLKGYIDKGLVEVHNIVRRHNQLVKEMTARGYNHKTPFKFFDRFCLWREGDVNSYGNTLDLKFRCKECKKRMEGKSLF